jgi:deoxyribonuclease V
MPGGREEKLVSGNKQIGWVLKSRHGCNPIFISPGNKVSIRSSLDIVKRCLMKHKLPEPLRLAHVHANEIKAECPKNGETDEGC